MFSGMARGQWFKYGDKRLPMLRFKSFLLEKAMFSGMARGQWFKYGDKRLQDLIDVIKDGNPVPDKLGRNLEIPNTPENIESIQAFMTSDDSVKTFPLRLNDGSIVQSNELGKSPIFGGKGAGAGATGNTADGESLQCLYLEAMLNEGDTQEFSHFTPQLLKKYMTGIDVDVTYEKMMGAADEWHYSAYVTAKHLIEKGYVNQNHKLHRGSVTMKSIYALKKQAFRNSGRPILTDDKWNPGDIWAVKTGVDPKRVLDKTTVETLNESIKENFLNRNIVGISLKQINSLKKSAKDEVLNLENVEIDKHRFTRVRIKADQANATFWSGKNGVIFYDELKKADIRAGSSMAAINVEILQKGARGGKAGYGQVEYAAKTYLGVKLPTNAELKQKARTILRTKKAPDLYRMVKAVDPSISQDEFQSGLETATIDRIHAKLGVTHIAHAIVKANKKQQDEFVSYMINYAGSKLSDSSVYVKVSAK